MVLSCNILYNSYVIANINSLNMIANINSLNMTQHTIVLCFNILGNGWFMSREERLLFDIISALFFTYDFLLNVPFQYQN